MRWTAVGWVLATCIVAVPAGLAAGVPTAHAKNGDTHITGQNLVQTLDCNESLLLVNGTGNVITAKGVCYAVTMQGSSNVVVADTVLHDITVYGWDQTAFFHYGQPALIDVGRQLGMVNRLQRVPA